MSKVCNNCGHSVEDNHKFCPNCGANVESEVEKNVLVCENCGWENSLNDSFCTECGAKLDSSNAKKTAAPVKPQVKQKKKKQGTEEKVSRHKAKKNEGKSLSKGTLIGIFTGALGLIIILLIAEGVFEKTSTPTTNTTPSANPKINLANIQEINQLDAQIKANPNNMELLLKLAHLRNDSGFYQQAINNYLSYLKNKPNDVDARIDMGVCYYNLKNFPKAIEEMERAIKINPNHQIGLLNLGVVNLTAGNAVKSTEWLKKAVKVNPNTQYGKRAQELLKAHKTN